MDSKTASAGKRRQTKSAKPKASGARQFFMAAAGLAVAIFIAYINSLDNQFVFDDHVLVFRLGRWQNYGDLLALLDSYRPLRNLTYILDTAVWGEEPWGYRLTNILIHTASAALVFAIFRRLTGQATAAFLGALIFALHPLQTDAVSYISGRRDVLFAVFYLAAFLAYLRYRERGSMGRLALFLACWGLSLMAKEMAVSLPLVIFLFNFCSAFAEESGAAGRRLWGAARAALWRDRWLYLALLGAALAFAYYYVFVKRASGRATSSGMRYWGGSLWATLLTMTKVHAWYLKQLLWPTPIAQYHGAFAISHSIFEVKVLASLALLLSVLGAAFAMLWRRPMASFAIFAYFAMLLPVSQIVPHHEIAADHYLYLPLAAFALLVALGIEEVRQRDAAMWRVAVASVLIWAALLGFLTIRRNRDWQSDRTLWQATYASVPSSPRAAYNLAGELLSTDVARAEYLYKQAIESDPEFEPPYLALARVYYTQRRYPEAEEIVRRGLSLIDAQRESYILRNPRLLRSQYLTELGRLKIATNEPEAGAALLREAIGVHRENMEAYAVLAGLYRSEPAKAQATVREALSVRPASYEMNAWLARLLIEEKNYEAARQPLETMLGVEPVLFDCAKARPHLTAAARAAAGPEAAPTLDLVRRVEEQCAGDDRR